MSPTPPPSSILHRSLEKPYPEAVGGHGIYLLTRSGDRILDGSSGAAVSCLGHSHPEVIATLVKQAQSLSFAHTSFFTSSPAEDLAAFLLDKSEGAFAKVLFLSSGSEAVESALKLARQYHVYNGQSGRINFIGRKHSYHGNTLGALAVGNNPARRETFAPMLGGTFHHVSRCFYDADGAGRSEEEYEDELIAELEGKIQELRAETVAAVVLEPVVGATIGSVPATKTYLPRLVALCRKHGILTIFDEVMCGMGRCGTYHAWQRLGNVAPDIQTIGKGLCAGYQPLSAVLVGSRVFDVFNQHSRGGKAFLSGHTFQGHPMGCAAALTVQTVLWRDGLIERCEVLGGILRRTLETELPAEWTEQHGSMRGLGLFQTLDFGTMKQKNGGPLAAEVARRSFDSGAAVYLCSPVTDAVLFAPPFVATDDEIRSLARIAIQALRDVLESRGK